MRQWIKKKLLERGMIVSRPPGQFSIFEHKLGQAKARGLQVGFAIDGGAAVGGWSEGLKRVYGDAKVLMIEPRDDCQEVLRQLKSTVAGLEIRQTLLGDREGELVFYESADQSTTLPGMASANARQIKRPVTTIDRLVQDLGWGWPDLIKLDLQGYELHALNGATETLQHTQAALIECSLLEFEPGMPLIADVFAYMKERGFALYDIPALWHRSLDGALAQGDFFFLRADHPLRARREWGPL